MADTLTKSIGSPLYSAGDLIFNNTALSNAGSIESDAFEFGRIASGLEINIVADAEITIADGQTMSIEILHSDTEDGTFTTAKQFYAIAPVGSAATIDAGLFGYSASSSELKHWCKVKINNSENQSTKTVTGYVKLTY